MQQQPRIVVYQPQEHGVVKHFNSSISRTLGIIQIVAGALCIICNIVGITLGAGLTFVGYGIWGGILFIVTGSIGLGAASCKSRCMIIAYMVLSIVAVSVCVLPIIIFSAVGLRSDAEFHQRERCAYRPYDYPAYYQPYTTYRPYYGQSEPLSTYRPYRPYSTYSPFPQYRPYTTYSPYYWRHRNYTKYRPYRQYGPYSTYRPYRQYEPYSTYNPFPQYRPYTTYRPYYWRHRTYTKYRPYRPYVTNSIYRPLRRYGPYTTSTPFQQYRPYTTFRPYYWRYRTYTKYSPYRQYDNIDNVIYPTRPPYRLYDSYTTYKPYYTTYNDYPQRNFGLRQPKSWSHDLHRRHPCLPQKFIYKRAVLQEKQAMHGLLICMALVEALVGIFAAVQGCNKVCRQQSHRQLVATPQELTSSIFWSPQATNSPHGTASVPLFSGLTQGVPNEAAGSPPPPYSTLQMV